MCEGAWSFHALSRQANLSESLYIHQPGSSPKTVLLGFYGGYNYALLIKSLAIGDSFQSPASFPSLEVWGMTKSFKPQITWLAPLETSLHS